MEPGFVTAIAPAVLGMGLGMAPIGWQNYPRLQYICRVGAIGCGFLTVALLASGILGIMGLGAVQRYCICIGVALVIFGFLYPNISQALGIADERKENAIPIRFLASQIVGKQGDADQYLLAAKIQFFNDGDEGQLEWSAAEALGLSVNDELKRGENIANTRALAARPSSSIGTYPLQKGPGIAETPPLTVSKEEYDNYFAGRRTFYFAGKMIVRTSKQTWEIPLCGYSPGDPNAVLQCPEMPDK
jgi:hypothetical protein